MSVRSSLSLLLIIWLIFSLARLIFDLVGKLWIVAVFDLLQIVCCITGLFGSFQKRRCLLIALLISNIISIVENILIFLWYIGIFGEITRPVLSGGLPYSFSFFLRYSPGCQSHFDLKRNIWVQHTCLIPFYFIEAFQSIFHIILAIIASVLTTFVLIEAKKKKPIRSCSQSINHYAQICAPKVANSNPPSDMSSGYVNSTYDEFRSQASAKAAKPPKKEINGQYERNSKRKKGKPRPMSMPAPDSAPCSSSKSSEEDIIVEDVYTKPIKTKSSSSSIRRSDDESDNASKKAANVTSLVSFDPKSATLLRIRQHLEAESDERDTPDSETYYERLRSRSSGSDIPPSTIPLSDYKSRNASQDSVPSIFAPMLNSPASSSTSASENVPPPPSSRIKQKLKPGGISLALPNTSPGIRLTDQLGANKSTYKSAFRVQSNDTRVIGHYHAPNEIPLSSDPTIDPGNDTDNTTDYPILTSGAVLV